MVESTTYNKRKNKQRDINQLVLSIAIIILCNYVGSFLFKRFDLTSEKRYTLSAESKEIAQNLKGVAFFRVYLEGKLPAGFIRLRDEAKEMLDEFRAYSGNKIQYEFINPSANPVQAEKEAFYKQLYKQGLSPVNLQVKDNSGNSEQIIFPGAILSYRGRDIPFDILNQQDNVDPQTALNNSIEALEYDIDNALHKLSIALKPKVAFIDGHGELDSLHTASANTALEEYYDMRRVPINHNLYSLKDYSAIIIAQPDSAFDEYDKYIIDQFIMNGGKVLWLIDPLYTPVDSLVRNGITIGFPSNLNLEDQLFKYGVRLNTNLVLDFQCSVIPINEAYRNEKPRYQKYPWYFTPLIAPPLETQNPIVKNLNLIEFNLASTLDTVGAKGIKKTILLTTSKETKLINAPARVSLAITKMKLDESQFRQAYQPVAVLLEGKFESLYKNRLPTKLDTSKAFHFKSEGDQTSMIVVSDGDVISNAARMRDKFAYPLGFDIYAETQFGNKDFIVNCMNYLCGDGALLSVRTKQLQLRLLDEKKAHMNKTQWQLINMIIPIALIFLLGILLAWVRKEKYAK
jgi:ABC-2 type transport system permease protein